MGTEATKPEAAQECGGPVGPLVIPPEVLDLLRFMCATWSKVDDWAYKHCDPDALTHYPVVQGTSNQIQLQRIGEQPYNTGNIHAAVKWMLDESHERWNAQHSPGTRQLCSECGNPTGRCEEDSIYIDDAGPLCESCEVRFLPHVRGA